MQLDILSGLRVMPKHPDTNQHLNLHHTLSFMEITHIFLNLCSFKRKDNFRLFVQTFIYIMNDYKSINSQEQEERSCYRQKVEKQSLILVSH